MPRLRAGVAAAMVLAALLAQPRLGQGTSYNPFTPDECQPALILTPGARDEGGR